MEKCVMLIMKSGKRETAEKIEPPNEWETIGEKEVLVNIGSKQHKEKRRWKKK